MDSPPPISFFKFFSLATPPEKILLIFSSIISLIGGCALPLFSLVFGKFTDSLSPVPSAPFNSKNSTNTTASTNTTLIKNPSIVDDASLYASYFVYIGIGIFICNGVSMGAFLAVSEKITGRLRKLYFQSLVKQEIGWFDLINTNELASKVSLEIFTIQQGIGEKVPTFLHSTSTVLAGFILSFTKGWELSLVLTGAFPVIALSGTLFAWVLTNIKKLTDNAYIHASALAEQSLNAIKTVKSLVSEDFEKQIFVKELEKAVKITLKYGVLVGFAIGALYFCFMSNYGLGLWFGSILIEEKRENYVENRPYNVGDVLTIFFCITMGSLFMAQIPPPIKAFIAAKQAGREVFATIERSPKIILNDTSKKMVMNVQGNIELKAVEFTYPARQEVKVLKKVNIFIEKGKKTAFVGESGSGKSTIVALIERFYDPEGGSITLDGIDLKEYNLRSLRENIGYVGQEPVLFSGTIRDNLAFGKEKATEEEMWEALKKANAADFVNGLQSQMDTFIGIGGNQLSGGQKQRIAIARAVLKNPPILLLDEATSALDRTNEMSIQKTLDSLTGGKTTVVIAHRLSTVQDADRIYVMANGEIDDFGTHEELLRKHGKYEALVKVQLTQTEMDEKEQPEVLPLPPVLAAKKSSIHEGLKKNSIYDPHRKMSTQSKHPDPQSAEQEHLQVVKEEYELQLKREVEALKPAEITKKKNEVLKRIVNNYMIKHYVLFFFAFLGATINGGVQPILAIVLGEIMPELAILNYGDHEEHRRNIDFLSGMFVVVATGSFLGNIFQSFCFSLLAEKITIKLKIESYAKILRKPMSFFDLPSNNPGVLSSRVSIDTQEFHGLINNFMGVLFQGLAGFVIGMIIAFIFSWQLTLVTLGLSPLVTIGQMILGKVMSGFVKNDEIYKESGGIIMETSCNIRTVASFCNEEKLSKKYFDLVEKPIKLGRKKGIISGLGFGASYFFLFIFYALVFYIAAHLQEKEGLSMKQFFIALFAILMASGATGAAANFLPDLNKGIVAADNVFKLLDSKEEEQYAGGIDQNKMNNFIGSISFQSITFKYPSREKYVFQNFNLEIEAGRKIAFVGPSGCGKSTLFQLLMRFYDLESGAILIDGVNINSMNVSQLRRIFGVVSQEPVLFRGTVSFNIKYNSESNEDEIRTAARQANALDFIENNRFDTEMAGGEGQNLLATGQGFNREVGAKGSQISGGQKQRLAIARAIIKKPKILLLDEATSALDAQNEMHVQESLNNIMKGKTSLCIAHRISTIKDADEILVFGEGRIVERGKYDELVQNQGVFYKFERGFAH